MVDKGMSASAAHQRRLVAEQAASGGDALSDSRRRLDWPSNSVGYPHSVVFDHISTKMMKPLKQQPSPRKLQSSEALAVACATAAGKSALRAPGQVCSDNPIPDTGPRRFAKCGAFPLACAGRLFLTT